MENFSNDETLRFSKWSHVFFKKDLDYFALFHSLNIETIFLENKFRKLAQLFKKGTTLRNITKQLPSISIDEIKEVCNELLNTGIIVPVLNDDKSLLFQKQKKYIFPVGLETLYLIVTDKCNLCCEYCFINNNMPKDYVCKSMSLDTAKEAVDMYFSNVLKNPPEYDNYVKMIVFYGGEPLLNFSLIKDVVNYVENKYKDVLSLLSNTFHYSIVTNGTAITEEMAEFFKKNKNINIAVSIDGTKEIHDQKRVFVGKNGSFDCAIRGLQKLKNIGGRNDVAISCTVDSHNIDNLPKLLDLSEKYGIPAVNLNPLLDTEQKKVSKSYMFKVSSKMLEYFALARERGIYEDRIMRKANSFIEKEIHAFDCQATGNQIVCSPDGQLGVCHEGIGNKSFFFGKVSRDFNFHENDLVKDWNKRSPLNMPQCWNCSALGICGGGCTYGSWLRNGSIWSIDDRFCIHSLMTLEWFIWDLFKRV